jgi:hypothetical protein
MSLALDASSQYLNITVLPVICYRIFTSAASSISGNWILTFGKLVLSILVSRLAQLLSKVTGQRLHLNNLFSYQLRTFLRDLGRGVGRFKSTIHQVIATKAGFSVANTRLLRTAVIGPIVEEAIHRLPLLILAPTIEALPFASALIYGALQITVAQVTKVALAAFLSVVFVYGHEITPRPGRAASLFASGLMYSYLTLKQPGGLLHAVVAHSVNNFLIGMHRWATSARQTSPPRLRL